MLVRFDLVARQFIGVPFLHQGRDPSIGIDCVGLIRCCADVLGIHQVIAHDRADYGRHPAHGMLEQSLRHAFGQPVKELQPGCIVAIDYKGQARHVAIVGEHPEGLSLIHTSSSVKRVTERRITPAYRKHIVGVYRLEVSA